MPAGRATRQQLKQRAALTLLILLPGAEGGPSLIWNFYGCLDRFRMYSKEQIIFAKKKLLQSSIFTMTMMIALLAVVVLVIRYLSLRIDDAKLQFQGFCNCVLVVKRRRLLQLQSVLLANAKHKKWAWMSQPRTYHVRCFAQVKLIFTQF